MSRHYSNTGVSREDIELIWGSGSNKQILYVYPLNLSQPGREMLTFKVEDNLYFLKFRLIKYLMHNWTDLISVNARWVRVYILLHRPDSIKILKMSQPLSTLTLRPAGPMVQPLERMDRWTYTHTHTQDATENIPSSANMSQPSIVSYRIVIWADITK